MKSKLLIIVMSTILFINTFDLTVFANSDYDHNELSKYNGYGQAMYESIVEETTFISGRYTDNKEYVSDSLNQITDFAKGWYNDTTNTLKQCYNFSATFMDCFGAHYEIYGATVLTAGDWIKSLFDSYDKSINIEDTVPDMSAIEGYFTLSTAGTIAIKTGFTFDIAHPKGVIRDKKSMRAYFTGAASQSKDTGEYAYSIGGLYVSPSTKVNYETYESKRIQAKSLENSVGGVLSLIAMANGNIIIKQNNEPITFPPRTPNDSSLKTINNYIQDSNTPQMVIPKPKAYLSCPDGTRINMTINGGTFLDVKGQVMQVSHDGTATVDSQLCTLGWDKPTITYEGDRVTITTPEGDIVDAETGEIIQTGEIDEDIPDDCGMICAIGKFMGGLSSIAKSILALPIKLLDGLFELIKKIVVPPENYFSDQMDALKDKFFNDEIEKGLESIEQLGSGGGGTFEDVNVSLMGVENVKVVDSTSVNKTLDTFHSWVRGVFYPLLLFFNINMLYRLIRGTSLVGIGRVGKGGGEN